MEVVRSKEHGLREVFTFTDFNPAAIKFRGWVIPYEEFIEYGLVNDAKQGLAVFHKGDKCSEGSSSADKAFGAVYGVEDPLVVGVHVMASEFLAEDAVFGGIRA